MPPDLSAAVRLTDQDLLALPEEEFHALAASVEEALAEDRRENQLLYYVPVSEKARQIHLATENTVAAFGGNGSSKTDTLLVELAIQSTGVVPLSLADAYPREKIKCPGKYRVVVESLTTTLHPIILPKLQWSHWDGIDEPGGRRGHWGWIPKHLLAGGTWEKAWAEKIRVLKLTCGCTWQFMSVDQDETDFASGSFHAVLHDEKPTHAIWRENRARVMRAGGRMYLAMTPPDEAGIAVDWIHDELYERGRPGPAKDPEVASFHLLTVENAHLDQVQVAKRAAEMTATERAVRLQGEFIHLTNRIHPLFTVEPRVWCFACAGPVLAGYQEACPACGGTDLAEYRHVEEHYEPRPGWPTVFLIDPHPRRPHAMAWITVDPNDDAMQVAELELDAEPLDVARAVEALEREHKLAVVRRLIDPNMGESPSNAEKRQRTWRQEFTEAGLRCDLACDAFDIGRSRVNDLLKPDLRTRRPRMQVHGRCPRTAYQFQRFVWEDWTRNTDSRDPKELPKRKHGDFPALWRYFANAGFTFSILKGGGEIIRTRRRG